MRRLVPALCLVAAVACSRDAGTRGTDGDGKEVALLDVSYDPTRELYAAENAGTFPPIELFTIDDVFGGRSKAQPAHFDEAGAFDQITAK